jgi:hypothetical protein
MGDALPTPVPLPEENLRAIADFEAAYATGRQFNPTLYNVNLIKILTFSCS